MDATILICTYNRSRLLGVTLDSIAALEAPKLRWDVMVVDNNSSDDTRAVVEARQADYPVTLHYLFEPRQGKSHALNTGLAHAEGAVIVFTDDDVEVPPEWLEAGVRPLLTRPGLAYTGGPVDPIWETPPPRWLAPAGNLGGTIAVTDHGPHPFIFEERRRTPLGVNMAVKRDLIEQIGGFRPDLGRRGSSLLGQEQAEFFYRSRAAGAEGLYVPEMLLRHYVPAARLTPEYFRRWWYWKGISQARLHRIHNRTELGLDLTTVPRLAGIPRYMLGIIVREGFRAAQAFLRGHRATGVEHQMMMWYAVGYTREELRRWLRYSQNPESAAAVDVTIKRVARST